MIRARAYSNRIQIRLQRKRTSIWLEVQLTSVGDLQKLGVYCCLLSFDSGVGASGRAIVRFCISRGDPQLLTLSV